MEWLRHIRGKFLRDRRYKVERAIDRLREPRTNTDALLAEMGE